jgi:hypothetical protein
LGREIGVRGSAGIILRGVSNAPTPVEPRSPTFLIAADTLPSMEGSQWTQRLALP